MPFFNWGWSFALTVCILMRQHFLLLEATEKYIRVKENKTQN